MEAPSGEDGAAPAPPVPCSVVVSGRAEGGARASPGAGATQPGACESGWRLLLPSRPSSSSLPSRGKLEGKPPSSSLLLLLLLLLPPAPQLFSPPKMSAFQINLGPLKEPLGFIKILQWIFSIFAFATCGGYSGKTGLHLTCPDNHNVTLVADFSYPFRLNNVKFGPLDTKLCNITWPDPVLVGDFSSSAQFFVTFAVFVFLYCMAALVLYVGYFHLYRGASKLPMIDFAVTVVVAFLWLVSTSAWAKALTDIKTSTGPSLIDGINVCVETKKLCYFDDVRKMGSLNVSVVIGFLNLILWAGNAWFVYKETTLHQPPATTSPNPAGPGVPSGM